MHFNGDAIKTAFVKAIRVPIRLMLRVVQEFAGKKRISAIHEIRRAAKAGQLEDLDCCN